MKNYIEKITEILTVEISQKKYNEVNIEHIQKYNLTHAV